MGSPFPKGLKRRRGIQRVVDAVKEAKAVKVAKEAEAVKAVKAVKAAKEAEEVKGKRVGYLLKS